MGKILNYTTEVPAERSAAQIQAPLVKHGATGVYLGYLDEVFLPYVVTDSGQTFYQISRL